MTSRPPADSGRRTDNPDPVDPFTDPTIDPMQDERQRVLRQVFGDQQGASPAGAFSPARVPIIIAGVQA
jgi:hypothetical protein